MSFHKVKNKVLNSIDIDVNRIINDHMNKMKEIIKEGWDVFPPWLLVGHGLLITVSFLIILFV
jgi:hypothetical protein